MKQVSDGEIDYDHNLVNTVVRLVDKNPIVREKGGLAHIFEEEAAKLITSFVGKDLKPLIEKYDFN